MSNLIKPNNKILTGQNQPVRTKQQEVNIAFNANLDQLIQQSIADGVQSEYIAESFYLRTLSVFQANAHNEEFIEESIKSFTDDLRLAVEMHKKRVENPNA